jgi:hypothetical protein
MTDFVPDCPSPQCPQAKIVWKDGKRFIEHDGEYQPFDSFVRVVLTELLSDSEEIKSRLAFVEDSLRRGLAP